MASRNRRSDPDQPEVLTPDEALTIGRKIAHDQVTPHDLAAIFAALLSSDDSATREEVLRQLIIGIALEDVEARETIDDFIAEVSRIYRIA
jgi:hypothetical protein